MTKLPFKRLALSIGVATTLVLAGCSSEDADDTPVSSASTPVSDVVSAILNGTIVLADGTTTLAGISLLGTATTYAVFSPLEGALPLPTDFLFADAADTDGTASIDASDDPTNPVLKAINDLDGWSTTAQIDLAFSGELDPATVKGPGAGQNVFLLVLNTSGGDGDALNPANIVGVDVAATTALQGKYLVSTISVDGGTNNVIRISPTEPLPAKRKFLAFVTNHASSPVKDIGGAVVGASAPYSYFGDPANNATLDAEAPTVGVRDLVQGLETVASGFINFVSGGAISVADARASLVITNSFTTTDPQATLLAMGAARAAMLELGVPAANVPALAALLPTPKPRTVAVSPLTGVDLNTLTGGLVSANRATLYTGAIELPSYSPVPASTADTSAFLGNWTANVTLASALGETLPTDDDGSYNVTYRFPFAAEQSEQQYPLQVTLPKSTHQPAGFPVTCGAAYGVSGYPVVIYVHGITSDRTSVMGLAHTLADKACVATVAIDLPAHGVASSNALFDTLNVENPDGDAATIPFQALYPGVRERHHNQKMGVDGLPVAMVHDGTDGSGALFINLLHLQNTRDNLRQGVMDLLNLNASLSAINALDIDGAGTAADDNFDLSKVYVVGMSLGGIFGTTFTAVNQLAYAADLQAYAATSNNANFAPYLNPIQGMVVSASGGELTKILENSQYISPQILGGLAAAGVPQGAADFDKFMYVAQSTVDVGDPLNFVTTLIDPTLAGFGLDVPTLFQSVIGGADMTAFGDTKSYVADKVIPNNAFPLGLGAANPAPLAGTDPLAELVGASDPSYGYNDVTSGPLITRIELGHHASLLRPNENSGESPVVGEYLAITELQTQAVSFIVDPAQTAVGTSSIVLPGPFTLYACEYVDGLVCP